MDPGSAVDPSPALAGADGRLTFLLDVDDTLLDNDALKEYLTAELRAALGLECAARFWLLYEEVRRERDVVNIPLTAQRFAASAPDATHAAALQRIVDAVPFRRFVYPSALDALRHLAALGTVGILSDGDAVFQRHKIEQSGLAAAVDGHVLIYTHKEQHLDEVTARWPADHFVLVDDKARILAAVATLMGTRITTVHVLQGHYAREPLPPGFRPDLTVPAIGDLRTLDRARFWPVRSV